MSETQNLWMKKVSNLHLPLDLVGTGMVISKSLSHPEDLHCKMEPLHLSLMSIKMEDQIHGLQL